MSRKSQPAKADEKTGAPESVADEAYNHYSYFQDYFCRDEALCFLHSLIFICQVERFAANGSVIEAPESMRFDYLSGSNVSDAHKRLCLWLECTGAALFARSAPLGVNWERVSFETLRRARLTLPHINDGMIEILSPVSGAMSVFLYDVRIVAASSVERFDKSTGELNSNGPQSSQENISHEEFSDFQNGFDPDDELFRDDIGPKKLEWILKLFRSDPDLIVTDGVGVKSYFGLEGDQRGARTARDALELVRKIQSSNAPRDKKMLEWLKREATKQGNRQEIGK